MGRSLKTELLGVGRSLLSERTGWTTGATATRSSAGWPRAPRHRASAEPDPGLPASAGLEGRRSTLGLRADCDEARWPNMHPGVTPEFQLRMALTQKLGNAQCDVPVELNRARVRSHTRKSKRGGQDAPTGGRRISPPGVGRASSPAECWTAPGLLDTRVRVFDLMRPPQLERVFPALPGPAFGSRSPRESNDGCTGS